jgi:hypothetical protein
MSTGGPIHDAGRQHIKRAIHDAEAISGFTFSVFVGPSDGDPRQFANRLHSALVDPDNSVLIMVDASARVVEVVTGQAARRALTDNDVGLAVLAMKTDFEVVGLASAIVRGLHQLAGQARRPESLRERS